MKELDEYDSQQIRTLLEQEHWLDPLPPVRRVSLAGWQRMVFWGLRIYIVIMIVIVAWGFSRSFG
jgi:hypothetical protein